MFVSTPIIRCITTGLERRGMLDEHHREALVKYDFRINAILTVAAAVAVFAYLVQ